jgi:N utilization substance protein A
MNKSPETPEALFIRVLQINPELAATLVESGFTCLEEVAYVPIDEFLSVGALPEQQIQTLRMRARQYLLVQIPGDHDEGDPLPAVIDKPPPPVPGGSSVPREDNDEN